MQKMKKLSIIFGILVLTIGLLAACGGANNEPAPEQNTEQEPPTNEGNADVEPGESDLLAVGEQQVQQSCLSCHGTDLQGGMGGAAPGLVGTNLSKEEIIDVLENGKGSMPGGLAQGNEEAVAEYILSLQ